VRLTAYAARGRARIQSRLARLGER
jgi:hypothetical protein